MELEKKHQEELKKCYLAGEIAFHKGLWNEAKRNFEYGASYEDLEAVYMLGIEIDLLLKE